MGVLVGVLYYSFSNGSLQEYATDKVINQIIKNQQVTSTVAVAEETNFIKKLLGFDGPQTYLVLLLNNTELRPGGGFIGSYATVQVDRAVPHILKVEGTEILDYSGYPTNFPSVPPVPFTTFLKLDRWYFRDSNWSPDFPTSASTSLDMYRKQRGIAAHEVKHVVAITTDVLEELLKITGPVIINGQEFTSANVVEKLEYEVERGFNEKNISRDDRKGILTDLVKIMVKKMTVDIFVNWSEYFSLAERMFEEKQVAIYTTDPTDQKIVEERGWGAGMKSEYAHDYLFWADANLGALKTDAAIHRDIYYTITRSEDRYIATVIMKYIHKRPTDWRTSRYLSYARLYVPRGSQFIRALGISKNALGISGAPIDQGDEFNRHWFGGFVSVEPLSQKDVLFQFTLAPEIAQDIKNGTYQLLVQKQIGTQDSGLTLNLDFGTTITNSTPKNQSGGSKYGVKTDLKKDREFILNLK
jgi:hypothetical protein